MLVKNLLKSGCPSAPFLSWLSFFAGSEPPNQLEIATRLTPLTWAI
jgi:hypothetical protein